ncbi:hypothetical protein F5148DRAFT_1148179 [Russula earlei]|uniref:Uncharacterized protein n=1 Tax=Russula earlei TaxID=71964 RepID=A0ACC0UEV4_9AGAM|nr:hypothetical protein F5148DRAFT_1148179 [Russula earlei]
MASFSRRKACKDQCQITSLERESYVATIQCKEAQVRSFNPNPLSSTSSVSHSHVFLTPVQEVVRLGSRARVLVYLPYTSSYWTSATAFRIGPPTMRDGWKRSTLWREVKNEHRLAEECHDESEYKGRIDKLTALLRAANTKKISYLERPKRVQIDYNWKRHVVYNDSFSPCRSKRLKPEGSPPTGIATDGPDHLPSPTTPPEPQAHFQERRRMGQSHHASLPSALERDLWIRLEFVVNAPVGSCHPHPSRIPGCSHFLFLGKTLKEGQIYLAEVRVTSTHEGQVGVIFCHQGKCNIEDAKNKTWRACSSSSQM